MNVAGILKKLKLLNPSAVAEMLSDVMGFDIAPDDVDRWLEYAKRFGPFISMGDRKVDELEATDVQDVIYGVFRAKVDEEGANALLDTARKMVTSPDETVRDLISSGKIMRLISLGPAASPKSTVIYCPDCHNPIIL